MGRRGPEPPYHKMGIHFFVYMADRVFVHSCADVPACLAEPLRRTVAEGLMERLHAKLRCNKNVIR